LIILQKKVKTGCKMTFTQSKKSSSKCIGMYWISEDLAKVRNPTVFIYIFEDRKHDRK